MREKIVQILIRVSLAMFANSLAPMAAQEVQHGLHAPRAKFAESRIEVPMDTTTRMPVIELFINDKGPFKFVVDSGAGGTVIDDDLAKQLDLPTIGTALTADETGNPPKPMSLVSVAGIRVGSAEFGESMAVIGDVDEVWHEQRDGADGVLAFNTFADGLVTFDYLNGKLIIEKGSLPPADGRDILTYVDDNNIPALLLTITGVETRVTIDTGASSAGILAGDMEGRVRTKSATKPVGKVRRMNNAPLQQEARIDGSLMLGRHEIKEPIFSFLGKRSVIGYHILKNFAITFDQRAKTVRFARSESSPITIASRYTAGFGAKPMTDGRKVWYVLDGLPAAKAGLKEGDLIVTANDRAMSNYDVTQWRALVEKPGTIRLNVLRDNAPQAITFDVVLAVE